jgi:hypothetical protein
MTHGVGATIALRRARVDVFVVDDDAAAFSWRTARVPAPPHAVSVVAATIMVRREMQRMQGRVATFVPLESDEHTLQLQTA